MTAHRNNSVPVSGRAVWAGRLGSLLLKSLGATWRIRILGSEREEELIQSGTPVIYAFWHGKLMTLAYTHRNRGATVLISQSRDGEIITQIIERMGYGTVRGSSSRGGLKAILDMVNLSRSGRILGVTPDGPQGPFEKVQPGLLMTAQRSGAAILAIGVAAHPSTRLGSWDAFLVPHPGARCLLSIAEPFTIPDTLPPAASIEKWTGRVGSFLKANDDHAHRQILRWITGDEALDPFLERFGHALDL
ncbi:MAG: lysophospholipid acyltransferase family protein [Candidatus Eisenbacteria bacterium]|uniref:Lysophospholipid acyltransferase family protein n=1 Tax=Eiseniibacteriota bacterium TaxID=2212470 RepID=A0A948W5Q5_UNCEI|nr:lysophospholipid acyltransferase family protein [Candidatus Eisenbacteria bacterium]MBU1949235.1 lysophospholipid acyltransferase family protein [Candidatus Eisenbacteria bacterium]MBU2690265.1 lysophospholipid acyltransferase family protein [Candidatus Eisenbacteria bacterium]